MQCEQRLMHRLVLLVKNLYRFVPGLLLRIGDLAEIEDGFLYITTADNFSLFNDAVIVVDLAVFFPLMSFQVHADIIACEKYCAIG